MSEGPYPKTVRETLPYIAWGSLIFTSFYQVIERTIEAEYGRALLAFVLGIVLIAMALHSKTFLERTNPNWAFFGAAIAVLLLVFEPAVERHGWPIVQWSTPLPSVDEIAEAVARKMPTPAAPIVPKNDPEALSQLAVARQSLTAKDKELQDTKSALSNAQHDLSVEHQKLLEARRPQLDPTGTLNFLYAGSDIIADLFSSEKAILITSAPENTEFLGYIEQLFAASNSFALSTQKIANVRRPIILQLPDYKVLVDAPKFPASGETGIVVHGSGPIQDKIYTLLNECFVTKKATRTPDEISEFYKRAVVWIEVGPGAPPWRGLQDRTRSSLCGS